jgi:hypothetical protein
MQPYTSPKAFGKGGTRPKGVGGINRTGLNAFFRRAEFAGSMQVRSLPIDIICTFSGEIMTYFGSDDGKSKYKNQYRREMLLFQLHHSRGTMESRTILSLQNGKWDHG